MFSRTKSSTGSARTRMAGQRSSEYSPEQAQQSDAPRGRTADRVASPATPAQLLARAVAWQAQREHTRYELERKLLLWACKRLPQLDHDDPSELSSVREQVHQALDQLQQRGWQSDSRFATNWISQRQSREGARKLIAGLRQRGIADSALAEVQPQASQNELERAQQLVLRRLNGRVLQTPQERARLLRYLAGRGFAPSVALKAVPAVGEHAEDSL